MTVRSKAASEKLQGGIVGWLKFAAILTIAFAVSPSTPANAFSPKDSTPGPVRNEAIDSDAVFAGLTVIKENVLGTMRGGFRVGGLDIGIGANVRTLFDGQVALESLITLTESGLVSRPVGANGETATRPGLTIIGSGGSQSRLRDSAPASVRLPGLNGSQGAVLNDNRGFTASLHQITRDRILSTVINQASGRRIRHEINVDVTIRNFRQFQQAVRSAVLPNRIANIR